MKNHIKLFALTLLLPTLNYQLSTLRATTTIDAANQYAYAANLGWVDWRGDTNNGVVIGEYVCSGYLYSANVGWLNLGSGSPANQIQYQNNSASDFGVNQDGLGNLRGYAWGANIGWVNFENNGAPKLDLLTGKFSGYAYSANCGWISLSNAVAYVQTDTIAKGTLAPNGLPAAWLLTNFGTTNVNASADADGDGQSNQQEYLAGTAPNNGADYLRITSVSRGTPHATYTALIWTTVPTRYYAVQQTPSLTAGAWADIATDPNPGWSNAGFDDFNKTNEFYRIRAYRPLLP
jgi:hypothetical protein